MLDLTAYIVGAMIEWSPTLTEDRARPIAADIAQVALEGEPLLPGDTTRAGTALLLAAIGWYESGWATWVGDGSCNNPEWRQAHAELLKKTGDCDGGKAFGYWQVHPFESKYHPLAVFHPTGPEILADEKKGIRRAREIARGSIARGHRLCDYVGEGYPSCPKADKRWESAHEYLRAHPPAAD
jgi:hypothetical protein